MGKRAEHLPTYRERVVLEALLCGRALPGGAGPGTIRQMARKGWITLVAAGKCGITPAGEEAFKRKLPDYQIKVSL